MQTLKTQLQNLVNNISKANLELFASRLDLKVPISTKITINSTLDGFLKNCLEYLLANKYNHKEICPFPYGEPKIAIEAISFDDNADTKEKLGQISNSLNNPEINVLDLSKYKSYIIRAALNGQNYLFINKKSPLKNFKNSSLFAAHNNTYKPFDNNLLQLTFHFDCITTDRYCYLLTWDADKCLDVNRVLENQKEITITELISNNIIAPSDEDILRQALKGYRKLPKKNDLVLQDLSNITPVNMASFEEKYNIKFKVDSYGKCYVDCSITQNLIDFCELISCKRGKDFDGSLIRSNTPFEKVPMP